ncbi:MAG: PIN domain-containing protein [Deltaproteobacteria bacterium]|nr:MAG: PIN domain-containing protein [Deltaproteobacteria bacterium]
MTHKAEPITSYTFTSADELLLDTNVWLLVYGPQKPGDIKVATYSQALAKILAAQCRIYIDVLIVSEFINAYARMKWKLVAPHINQFKAFRRSPDFKPVAQDIAADVRCVLNHCSRIENGFEALNIVGLIDEYAAGDADFNDQIIAVLCKRKGLKLVTDDGDFSGQGIPVLTANKRLLV